MAVRALAAAAGITALALVSKLAPVAAVDVQRDTVLSAASAHVGASTKAQAGAKWYWKWQGCWKRHHHDCYYWGHRRNEYNHWLHWANHHDNKATEFDNKVGPAMKEKAEADKAQSQLTAKLTALKLSLASARAGQAVVETQVEGLLHQRAGEVREARSLSERLRSQELAISSYNSTNLRLQQRIAEITQREHEAERAIDSDEKAIVAMATESGHLLGVASASRIQLRLTTEEARAAASAAGKALAQLESSVSHLNELVNETRNHVEASRSEFATLQAEREAELAKTAEAEQALQQLQVEFNQAAEHRRSAEQHLREVRAEQEELEAKSGSALTRNGVLRDELSRVTKAANMAQTAFAASASRVSELTDRRASLEGELQKLSSVSAGLALKQDQLEELTAAARSNATAVKAALESARSQLAEVAERVHRAESKAAEHRARFDEAERAKSRATYESLVMKNAALQHHIDLVAATAEGLLGTCDCSEDVSACKACGPPPPRTDATKAEHSERHLLESAASVSKHLALGGQLDAEALMRGGGSNASAQAQPHQQEAGLEGRTAARADKEGAIGPASEEAIVEEKGMPRFRERSGRSSSRAKCPPWSQECYNYWHYENHRNLQHRRYYQTKQRETVTRNRYVAVKAQLDSSVKARDDLRKQVADLIKLLSSSVQASKAAVSRKQELGAELAKLKGIIDDATTALIGASEQAQRLKFEVEDNTERQNSEFKALARTSHSLEEVEKFKVATEEATSKARQAAISAERNSTAKADEAKSEAAAVDRVRSKLGLQEATAQADLAVLEQAAAAADRATAAAKLELDADRSRRQHFEEQHEKLAAQVQAMRGTTEKAELDAQASMSAVSVSADTLQGASDEVRKLRSRLERAKAELHARTVSETLSSGDALSADVAVRRLEDAVASKGNDLEAAKARLRRQAEELLAMQQQGKSWKATVGALDKARTEAAQRALAAESIARKETEDAKQAAKAQERAAAERDALVASRNLIRRSPLEGIEALRARRTEIEALVGGSRAPDADAILRKRTGSSADLEVQRTADDVLDALTPASQPAAPAKPAAGAHSESQLSPELEAIGASVDADAQEVEDAARSATVTESQVPGATGSEETEALLGGGQTGVTEVPEESKDKPPAADPAEDAAAEQSQGQPPSPDDGVVIDASAGGESAPRDGAPK
ncbi:hypothetical protein FNF27_02203 [Cafeteria roenbergensis]|uniref:WW domain-containing protein n=2 Tax=Cafeteria roenbergensis TaxID=33653 RepID=A0A5A8EIQ9_CAFRO|nr:hypothetical protein FNF27_02203 [Cafeteria roenbergensis]